MTYSKAIFPQVATLEIGKLILVRLSEKSGNDWRGLRCLSQEDMQHRASLAA
jgi:hypothetical protein